MFDLPTGNKAERRSYTEFRKFLIKDGYRMEQFSIYSRLLLTRESASTHIARIKANLPKAGIVTVIELTERQYENRLRLLNTAEDERSKTADNSESQLTLVL